MLREMRVRPAGLLLTTQGGELQSCAGGQPTIRSAKIPKAVKWVPSSCPAAGDPGCFISAAWLTNWADADGSTPVDPIDNSPLLCPHSKLDPHKAAGEAGSSGCTQ